MNRLDQSDRSRQLSLSMAVVASLALSIATAQDNSWTGSTSADWNTATNWSLGNVPTAQNAIVDSAPANIATISADIPATPNDIVVRGGGRLDHVAGTAGTGGGSWMFIGQNDTAGTYNLADTNSAGSGITGFAQGTGSLNATGNLLVGAFGDNRTGTVRVNTIGTLAVSGELFVGDSTNSVGSFDLESGTVTVNNKTLIGNNNGVGVVVQSGGTITVSSELYIGNENANASGTYTLSGTGALNVANEVVVGRESGTGILNVDGGTVTTSGNGNMYIGRRNGTGTLNQTAGTINVNREFGVGTRDDNKIGTGTYNLSGGSLTAANNIFIGKELGASGTMTMTGGTLATSDKLQIGHNQATGFITQSGGVVNVQNEVYIGNETDASSVGTYTLSGTASLNVGNEVLVGRDNGTGTFNLDGGTVTTKKIEGGTGSATVNFNGGVVKAKENQATFITGLDVANLQAGGLAIDTDGFDVAIAQVLTGTGGLTKSGAGRLTLNGSNTYAGATTVTAGSLFVDGGQANGAVQVDAGGTLGGSGVIGGAATIDGVLSPGNSPGVLTVDGLVLAGSSTSIFEIDGLVRGTQYDGLDITGSSGPTYGGTLSLVFGNASAFGNTEVFNLFDFTGASAGGFSSVTSTGFYGGTWSGASGLWTLQSGGQTLTFSESTGDISVVPEPAILGLVGIGMAAAAGARRRRAPAK